MNMKANNLSIAPLQQLIKEIMAANEQKRRSVPGYIEKRGKIKLRRAAVLKIRRHLQNYLACCMKSMIHVAMASNRSTIMPSDHELQRQISLTYLTSVLTDGCELGKSESSDSDDTLGPVQCTA
jgi:histone H3/H4